MPALTRSETFLSKVLKQNSEAEREIIRLRAALKQIATQPFPVSADWAAPIANHCVKVARETLGN